MPSDRSECVCRLPRYHGPVDVKAAGRMSRPYPIRSAAGRLYRLLMHVRDATAADAEACAAIYAPYVTDTAITFELEVPTAAAMAERIARAAKTHGWLVAEDGGIVGYAYGGPYKERAAY